MMIVCECCGKELTNEEAIECIDSNDKKVFICEECDE